MKAQVKRIGRYWIDKALLDEGYGPEDLCGGEDPEIEVPEMLESFESRKVRWLWCPCCSERTQISLGRPSCVSCGWNEESSEEHLSCAA